MDVLSEKRRDSFLEVTRREPSGVPSGRAKRKVVLAGHEVF